jgi:hypothetical protein
VARIVYRYQVGETVYESEQVGFETVPVEASSEAGQRLLGQYPAGAQVTVYHDPADPANAVLEREPPAAALRGGVLSAVLGLGVLALRRLWRNRPYEDAA